MRRWGLGAWGNSRRDKNGPPPLSGGRSSLIFSIDRESSFFKKYFDCFTKQIPYESNEPARTMAGGALISTGGTIEGGFLTGRALYYPVFLITLLFFLWGFSYG